MRECLILPVYWEMHQEKKTFFCRGDCQTFPKLSKAGVEGNSRQRSSEGKGTETLKRMPD